MTATTTQRSFGLTASTLKSHIEGDIVACKNLIALQEQEYQALGEKDIDTLEVLLSQKALYLEHLEKSAATRAQWVNGYQEYRQNNDTKPDEAIENSWIALIHQLQSPDIITSWNELKRLIKTCQDKNEVNGKIISRNQKTFKHLLNILRGQPNTQSLYTKVGNKSSGHDSQQLGQA